MTMLVQTDEEARKILIQSLGLNKGLNLFKTGNRIAVEAERLEFYNGLLQSLATGTVKPLVDLPRNKFRTPPTDMRTFLYDTFYLGVPHDELWPEVVSNMIECNNGNYIEAVLTGAIGTAKTTIALYTQAYQLYLLSCYYSPQRALGIAATDEIIFIFQNLSATLAKVVDFERFKAIIDRSYYFNAIFPYDRGLSSELRFPHRITVKPVSGAMTAAIGQNVYSGIIDEVNFMAVVENSKQSRDGGDFDQAKAIYNSISMRRKTRFMQLGSLPGVLCIVSSRNYPGQFTDVKEEEAKKEIERTGKTNIFIYDKRTWELAPEKFCGKKFKVFIGDETRKPRIMEKGEKLDKDDKHLMMKVPIEFLDSFERDINHALRDVAGVATLARFPFIPDVESVQNCFGVVDSVLSREDVDFVATQLKVFPNRFKDPDKKRFVHIDLGLTADSAGVVCGYVDKFIAVNRGNDEVGLEDTEILPDINIDFILEVKPPKGGEIKFFKIRKLLYTLKAQGLNIRWVTLDSYQSQDTIQLLRQKGFVTGKQSMDTSMLPYEITKTALYDGRIKAPAHAKAAKELVSLEKDPKKGKIDHPPTGSKDCSDGIAGVVHGLTMRREIWIEAGINPTSIPDSIMQAIVKDKDKMKAEEGEATADS